MACLLLLAPSLAGADDGESYPQADANIFWTLLGNILVMFMQPGFAMVECSLISDHINVRLIHSNFG
jgi:hypothetical protein